MTGIVSGCSKEVIIWTAKGSVVNTRDLPFLKAAS
jgi:hypothetical protein